MKDGKNQIMGAIRKRLAGRERVPPPSHPVPPALAGTNPLALFADRVREAKGSCELVDPGSDGVPSRVRSHIRGKGMEGQVGVACGLDRYDWEKAGLRSGLSFPAADCVVGVTGAACAVATTGSIVVTSSSRDEVELSLLPPHHICVVAEENIVADLGEALEKILDDCLEPPRNIAFVTGPSVTADIEQSIVRGAHGPISLHVIIERTAHASGADSPAVRKEAP